MHSNKTMLVQIEFPHLALFPCEFRLTISEHYYRFKLILLV
jgi:hypothetical protein